MAWGISSSSESGWWQGGSFYAHAWQPGSGKVVNDIWHNPLFTCRSPFTKISLVPSPNIDRQNSNDRNDETPKEQEDRRFGLKPFPSAGPLHLLGPQRIHLLLAYSLLSPKTSKQK